MEKDKVIIPKVPREDVEFGEQRADVFVYWFVAGILLMCMCWVAVLSILICNH